jgi:hypothetical protein
MMLLLKFTKIHKKFTKIRVWIPPTTFNCHSPSEQSRREYGLIGYLQKNKTTIFQLMFVIEKQKKEKARLGFGATIQNWRIKIINSTHNIKYP